MARNFAPMLERPRIPSKNYLHIITIGAFQERKIQKFFKPSSSPITSKLNKKTSQANVKAPGNKDITKLSDLFTMLDKIGVGYLVYEHLKTHENQGIKKLKLYYTQCERVVKDASELIESSIGSFLKISTGSALSYSLVNEFLPNIGTKPDRTTKDLFNLPLNLVSNGLVSTKRFINLQQAVGWRRNPVEQLRLGFDNSQNSEVWFNKVVSRISKHFTRLQSLTLSFNYCLKITDKTLKKLRIGRMRELKHLDLDFTFCYGITSTQVNQFFYTIGRRLINLEVLKINFSRCYAVLDSSLATFGRALRTELNNLRRLSLLFDICTGITDKGLKNLVFFIKKNLPNLTSLCLSFKSCQTITDEGLGHLGGGIRTYMMNLKMVRLDFDNCSGVSNIAKTKLRETLSFVPRVQVH